MDAPSGVTATPDGNRPVGMERTTRLVRASMTETSPDPLWAAESCLPSAARATLAGWLPTRADATTRLVRVSRTETRLEPPSAGYRYRPLGLSATPVGLLLRGSAMVLAMVLLAVLRTDTVLLPALAM